MIKKCTLQFNLFRVTTLHAQICYYQPISTSILDMLFVCCGSLSPVNLVMLGTEWYQYTDTDKDSHLSFTDGVNTLHAHIYEYHALHVALTIFYHPYI